MNQEITVSVEGGVKPAMVFTTSGMLHVGDVITLSGLGIITGEGFIEELEDYDSPVRFGRPLNEYVVTKVGSSKTLNTPQR